VELLSEGADILHALTKASSNLSIELHLAAQNFSDDPNVLVIVMLIGILGLILLVGIAGEMGKRVQAAPAGGATS
jgi:hypothetical protein